MVLAVKEAQGTKQILEGRGKRYRHCNVLWAETKCGYHAIKAFTRQ